MPTNQATAWPLMPPSMRDSAVKPIVSVAAGAFGGPCAASRSIEIRHSSEALLGTIAEVLAEAGVARSEIGGLVGVLGPGSFTGLRVGMATLLGLHQAVGCPATGVGTFDLLARVERPPGDALCVVDALRDEWFAQRCTETTLAGETELMASDAIVSSPLPALVGHEVEKLAERATDTSKLVVAGALAPLAFELMSESALAWDPGLLLAPRYLRAPAVARPR